MFFLLGLLLISCHVCGKGHLCSSYSFVIRKGEITAVTLLLTLHPPANQSTLHAGKDDLDRRRLSTIAFTVGDNICREIGAVTLPLSSAFLFVYEGPVIGAAFQHMMQVLSWQVQRPVCICLKTTTRISEYLTLQEPCTLSN